MKRFIACFLMVAVLSSAIYCPALASEIDYAPVNFTLLSNSADEQEFRQWAANVIDTYYTSYCLHDLDFGQYYSAVDFPRSRTREIWNSIWGSSYIDLDLSVMGQFDGIYRTYYFASLAKLNSDFNIHSSTYTIVRADNESDDDYIKKMKPFYKMLLIDAMEDEGVIDMAEFDNAPEKKGNYTLMKDSNGNMTMQFVENGVMDSLDKMAAAEANKAWMNFGEAMITTCLEAITVYAELNAPSGEDGLDIMKALKKAASEAVGALLKSFTDAVWDNEVNRLKNNMREAVRCDIANRELSDYNRTIAYLKNVYNDKEASFVQYKSDPVFKLAVQELITELGDQYDVCHEKLISYALDDFPIQKVMTKDEMFSLVLDELVVQLFNIVFSPIDAVCKDAFKNGTSSKKFWAFLSDYLTTLLKGFIKLEVEQIAKEKKGEKTDASDETIKKGMLQELLDVSIKILNELENGEIGNETLSDNGDRCYRDIVASIAKEFKTVYDLMEKMNKSTLINDDWQKLKESGFKIVGAVFKAVHKNLGKNIKAYTDRKFTGELTQKALGECKAVLDVAVEMLDTSIKAGESLAKGIKATLDLMSNEKQTSYRAVAMASAYKASSAIELDLFNTLKPLKTHSGGIKGAILDPDATTASDVLKWTDKIILQVKYDIIGSRWLVEILALGEQPNKFLERDSAFYSYLMQISDGNIWQNAMKSSNVNSQRTTMIEFREKIYNKGWKEAFRKYE